VRIWLAPSAYAPAIGGVEEATARLAEVLVQRGHDVRIVTHRWPSTLSEMSIQDGQAVHRLTFTAPSRHPRTWAPHAAGSAVVQRALDALPVPDVVHVHCVAGQAMHLVRYCRRHHVRLVVTTHGETAMDSGRLYQRSPLQRRALRTVASRADVLTACSAWTKMHASGIAAAFSSAEVVPNGVRLSDWTGLPEVSDPVFAAYGRHVRQKGFDVLLHAFRLVRSARPDAQLWLAGVGDQTAELRRLAGPGVQLPGPLDRAGVRALLGRVRTVVVPSLVEPFGIVALEALAAGRRLVYSDVGGLAEVADGHGWPATAGDAHSLAAAMIASLDEPARGPRTDRLECLWSWSAVTDKYLAAYCLVPPVLPERQA